MYGRGAEQGATDFGEGPNQSSIGCLLLSINPPLLKRMSGNLRLKKSALRIVLQHIGLEIGARDQIKGFDVVADRCLLLSRVNQTSIFGRQSKGT